MRPKPLIATFTVIVEMLLEKRAAPGAKIYRLWVRSTASATASGVMPKWRYRSL